LLGKRDEKEEPNDVVDSGLPGTVPDETEVIDYLNSVPAAQQALATLAVQGINNMYQHSTVGADTF